MLKTLYTVSKTEIGLKNCRVRTWELVSRRGTHYMTDGCISLPLSTIHQRHEVFETLSEAEFLRDSGAAALAKRRAEEHLHLAAQQRKKAESEAEAEASMEFIKNTLHIAEEFQFAVFKTFMKELVFIDTKLVNKALFAVTLNKRFRGFFYKVENDPDFLSHVSANEMKEVLEMILSRQ